MTALDDLVWSELHPDRAVRPYQRGLSGAGRSVELKRAAVALVAWHARVLEERAP